MNHFFQFFFSTKSLVYALIIATGLAILFLRRVNRLSRIILLAIAFFLLAGLIGMCLPAAEPVLGLHPSPMCNITKFLAFIWNDGKYPMPLLAGLAVITLFSLIGKKLFCGWVCPLGAIQEILYLIPGLPKLRNVSFKLSNGVRTGLFAIFIIGLLTAGVITYDIYYLNAFEGLHWNWTLATALPLVTVLLVALFYYRPFCYFICPIGLISWILERFAWLRLRVDLKRCTSCQLCVKKSPCPAIAPLVKGEKGFLPDCTSCGLCVNTCPEQALHFGTPRRPQA